MKNCIPILFLFSVLLFSYCHKGTDGSSSILGKWKIDSVQLRMAFPDHIEYMTIYKPASDYYDFRSDNKLYRLWMGTYDTINYQVIPINNKKLIQYPGTADTILTLTGHSLLVKNPQGSDSKIFMSK